jgi:hypothetical protein
MDDSVKHFFFYAKYHYPVHISHSEALKVLVKERCGVPSHYIGKQAILTNLVIALKQIKTLDWSQVLQEFFERFENGWDNDSDEAKFNFLLKFLCHARIDELKFHLNRSDIDPKVYRMLRNKEATLLMSKWKGLGRTA